VIGVIVLRSPNRRYNDINMNSDQLNRLTSSVLVHTTQMAYVEEAPGTHALMEGFTEIFRYLSREKKSISIKDEWIILKKYIHLQHIRYPGRFEIDMADISESCNTYIYSGMILEFFDQALTLLLDSSESLFKLHININPGKPSLLNINISTNIYQNIKHKQLELPDGL